MIVVNAGSGRQNGEHMEMIADREGVTESRKPVPIGTRCTYEGHVSGGMVRVRLPDGTSDIVHPHIFACLR